MSEGCVVLMLCIAFADIRQHLIHSEIGEITNKITALDEIRARLEQDVLKLQEDDLELDAECAWPSNNMFQGAKLSDGSARSKGKDRI
jgi:hypothetical protein